MNLKRKAFAMLLFVFIIGLGAQAFAQPVFEGQTPTGFSVTDSTRQSSFATDKDITLLVDLNETANNTYPVIGNFQKVEQSVPFFSSGETAGYMSQAIAVDANGIIHRAWIQQRATIDLTDATSSPVFGVVYSKSFDGGKTFTDTVSVSGSLRFDMITPNLAMSGGFSTVDIVVDSKGNPRVAYAFNNSADGIHGWGVGAVREATSSGGAGGGTYSVSNNIYFNYSNDGGSSWLPSNAAVVINDTTTINAGAYDGRKCAFPRMDISSTDDIFMVYQRGMATIANSDIMLAKMEADSLELGSAQAVAVGSMGQSGSRGGVRIEPNGNFGVTPDIAVGDDDVLHIVWYVPTNNTEAIQHKNLPADMWSDVSGGGWDNVSAGATAGQLDCSATNAGLDWLGGMPGTLINYVAHPNLIHLFPTIVVDKERSPDRVYALWKHSDAVIAGPGADENIAYNFYTYNGITAGGASWGSASVAFPAGGGTAFYNAGGGGLFQNGTRFQIEDGWAYVDRIAAVIDDRVSGSRGDLHIVFSGGASHGAGGDMSGALAANGEANNLYYVRFNGTEWELPQVVATAQNGTADGVLAASRQLFSPDIDMRSGDDNVYLTFVGGSPALAATEVGGRISRVATATATTNPGRGYATLHTGNVTPLPYFKIIGRVLTFEDISQPVGAYQYLLTYNPVNPQTSQTNNLIVVSAADNQDGSGIGGGTPGTVAGPGGFLTGQWRRAAAHTLGVTSLNPGDSGAIYKGAISQSQATSNTGVWEGQVNDDGSAGFGEWGDDGDKADLLVKLNVLGSDSSTNVRVISASSAAVGSATAGNATGAVVADSSTQSINIDADVAAGANDPSSTTFIRGITVEGNATIVHSTAAAEIAPTGSFFIIGPDIDIVADNTAPVLSITNPDATTLGTGAFGNQTATIQYTLYDSDNDFSGTLTSALYAYPDNGLSSVLDIQTFGRLIVDQNDDTNAATRVGTDPTATNDFVEGFSATNVQTYTWDDPGTSAQTAHGWAPVTKQLDGTYYIYVVADDGTNRPVFAVSAGQLRIRHIPIVEAVAPVAADTVDTGEYDDLDKVNPYKVKFSLLDYDDNAQARLFISTQSDRGVADVSISGTFPSLTMELNGAVPIQLSDTLRTDEDIEFEFDVTAQGSTQDSLVGQGNYFIYAIVADDDSFAVGLSSTALAVRHSPAFEFTAPLTGRVDKINTTQQSLYTIQWQRGRSDLDLDGNATVSLYYTGVDPAVRNYSGTDSTALVATSGTLPGSAVLISGGIREDDEGAYDQYVWDFRNPPGALPKTFRAKPNVAAMSQNPHTHQVGTSVDTAWIYAVLADSLANTRVQLGGGVLLLGSQESPASQAPRVTMRTPPAGGQTIINGDVVRLEWDAFLIDDGTGTDDAYLRLYAAPKNKYTTLTQLEANNVAEGGDVFLVNSLTGQDDVQANITTLRESGESFYLWDTKSTSFRIRGTPTELDIFVAGSMDPQFGDNVYVGSAVDSVASGIGANAQMAVLSKSPGALRVEGADPIFSIELGPGAVTASSGDILDFRVLVNSQNSSVNLMAFHLDVPRNYFDVVDQDANIPGVQPFADSTGAFISTSTIAQNDTTQGTEQFLKLNFVESIILGETIGKTTGDSSQVAAKLQLAVKRYQGGATMDTLLVWSPEAGRKTGLFNGTVTLAAPARDATVTLTPRARVVATAPLEGRADYSDTLDVHLREIGSTQDITDQEYIQANDVKPDTLSSSGATTTLGLSNVSGTFTVSETVTGSTSGARGTVVSFVGSDQTITPISLVFSVGETATGATSGATGTVSTITENPGTDVVLGDSVQVVSDAFGTFSLTEIPVGIYEITVKAKGYVSGRTDTLNLFDGLSVNADPTFASDLLGNLSPATSLGALRGGDATGDNQVDIADANRVFSLWNLSPADADYVREADINVDAVINALDLGFVTTNFGNDGYGAAPVFKRTLAAGDNAAALVEVTGIEDVEAWWPGRVFEVTAKITGMTDVMAYGLSLSYDPERVKLLDSQAVSEGDVFAENPRGSLFFQRVESGRVDVTAGRIGREWSASGDAELVTVRFVTLTDDPGQIQVVSGDLVNSDFRGVPMQVKQLKALPKVVALHQNYPNPFNPSTEIRFDIPTARDVQLRIFNQLGQTVRTLVDQRIKAGSYRLKWDGKTEDGHSVSSGVYFYSLEAGDFSQIRKMTLVK